VITVLRTTRCFGLYIYMIYSLSPLNLSRFLFGPARNGAMISSCLINRCLLLRPLVIVQGFIMEDAFVSSPYFNIPHRIDVA